MGAHPQLKSHEEGGESFLRSFHGRLRPNVTDPPSRGRTEARFPRIIILLSYNSSNSWERERQVCRCSLASDSGRVNERRRDADAHGSAPRLAHSTGEKLARRTFVTYGRRAFRILINPILNGEIDRPIHTRRNKLLHSLKTC